LGAIFCNAATRKPQQGAVSQIKNAEYQVRGKEMKGNRERNQNKSGSKPKQIGRKPKDLSSANRDFLEGYARNRSPGPRFGRARREDFCC
jgi:hypothetical protein